MFHTSRFLRSRLPSITSANVRRCLSDTQTVRPEPQVAENLMQIGSRKVFSYEHDMFRELCRNFYKDNVIPFHDKWEDQGSSQVLNPTYILSKYISN